MKRNVLPLGSPDVSGYLWRRIVQVAALLLGGGAMAAGPEQDNLRRLIDSAQYAEAYKVAVQFAEQQGDPHFDLLYGIAAVNAGQYASGVVALERHLLVVPANDRARLELAKGYYELSDYIRARREFEFVLRYNPPKDVRDNIQKYLDAMQSREVLSSKASARSFVELGVGRDSNVNAGTYVSQFTLLPGLVVAPDPSAMAVGSEYAQLTAGVQWIRRIDSSLAVFAGGDLDQKLNSTSPAYDTFNVGAYAGFSVTKAQSLYRITVSQGHLQVNAQKFRNTLAVTGEGQLVLGQGYTLTGVAQFSELSHATANSVRDANLLTWGGGIQKAFIGTWRPTIALQMTKASESNLHLRDDLSKDSLTTRLSITVSPDDRLSVSTGISHQGTRYALPDIAFTTNREDTTWTADVGISYLWSRSLLFRLNFLSTENESNQGLYAYRRVMSGLSTRYIF